MTVLIHNYKDTISIFQRYQQLLGIVLLFHKEDFCKIKTNHLLDLGSANNGHTK